MKTAVILPEGIKQIVFTPENKDEEYALSLLTPDDDIELLIEDGSFGYSHGAKPYTKTVSECRGGWLKLYEDVKSRILILKPREKTE